MPEIDNQNASYHDKILMDLSTYIYYITKKKKAIEAPI